MASNIPGVFTPVEDWRTSEAVAPVANLRLATHKFGDTKKVIDEFALLFYYHLNTGKEVIEKYMSSKHSEVAET